MYHHYFIFWSFELFPFCFPFSNRPFPFQRCVGNVARLCPARSQQSEPWINSSTPTVSVAWAVIAPCRVCSSMTGMAPLSVKTATWWANTNKLSEWSKLHITQSLVHEKDEMIKRKDRKLKPKDNLLTKHFELCLFLNQDTTQYFFHFLFEKWESRFWSLPCVLFADTDCENVAPSQLHHLFILPLRIPWLCVPDVGRRSRIVCSRQLANVSMLTVSAAAPVPVY